MTREETKIRNYLIEIIEQETDDDKLQKDCRQLLRLGKKTKDDKAIGNAYFFLGWNDMKKGRYRKAIENVQEAMPYLKKARSMSTMSDPLISREFPILSWEMRP